MKDIRSYEALIVFIVTGKCFKILENRLHVFFGVTIFIFHEWTEIPYSSNIWKQNLIFCTQKRVQAKYFNNHRFKKIKPEEFHENFLDLFCSLDMLLNKPRYPRLKCFFMKCVGFSQKKRMISQVFIKKCPMVNFNFYYFIQEGRYFLIFDETIKVWNSKY